MTDETGMTDDKRHREILAEELEARQMPSCAELMRSDKLIAEPIMEATLAAMSRASVSLPVTDDPVREALQNIARQKTLSELSEAGEDCEGDFEGAYDTMIELARKALTSPAQTEGYKLVPVEPTEEQWGGLARDIVMWSRFQDHSGASLYRHLRSLGRDIPEWLLKEIPDTDRVPAKGTVAAVIYKAMLAASPSTPEGK